VWKVGLIDRARAEEFWCKVAALNKCLRREVSGEARESPGFRLHRTISSSLTQALRLSPYESSRVKPSQAESSRVKPSQAESSRVKPSQAESSLGLKLGWNNAWKVCLCWQRMHSLPLCKISLCVYSTGMYSSRSLFKVDIGPIREAFSLRSSIIFHSLYITVYNLKAADRSAFPPPRAGGMRFFSSITIYDFTPSSLYTQSTLPLCTKRRYISLSIVGVGTRHTHMHGKTHIQHGQHLHQSRCG
jgi:hypothetical protein